MPHHIHVVLAVFRPDPDYLRAQIESLARQTHADFDVTFVIADLVSDDLVKRLAAAGGLRFRTVIPVVELDGVRAFEAGLYDVLDRVDPIAKPAPADAAAPEPFVALCDQDDIWHPDRLERGVAALGAGTADLVHSDARLVDAAGAEQHRSMFAYERRVRKPGLRGLLYRNTITGMTALMTLRVVRVALPFPRQSGVHFYHDLWLGLVAAAMGGVLLIDRPLVDYRQHGDNAIGAVDRRVAARRLGGGVRRFDTVWIRRQAAAYALARYLAHELHHRMIDAVDDGRLPDGSVRLAEVRPFLRRMRGGGAHAVDALRLAATGATGPARIAAGFFVVAAGRLVWSLRQVAGPGLANQLDRFDARLWSLSPGVAPKMALAIEDRMAPRAPVNVAELIDIRKRPRWLPQFGADRPALTVLVPTLNPTEMFAGISTALDIGLGLATLGRHVRFVATDLPVSSTAASRRFLLSRLGSDAAASGAATRLSLHCGVSGMPVPAHADDRFLATAWWSAHIADTLIREHGFTHSRFHYLIQDHEPHFYAWGPEFADAEASYDLGFEPIFNTTLLRDHFARMGHAFATPDALAFRPSIDVGRYARGVRPDRDPGAPRRIVMYGRPEVARNMYQTAVEALSLFVEAENLKSSDVAVDSIGLRHSDVNLSGGVRLRSLGKLPWEDYPGALLSYDLGLSLMYSPHPSHPPIEMAASGIRTVTNRFGPKDLSLLSPAILSAAATAPDIAVALSRAYRMGPVRSEDRRIDLDPLGLEMPALVAALSRSLGTSGKASVAATAVA